MRSQNSSTYFLAALLVLSTMGMSACNKSNANGNTAQAASESGKIPITTKSDEARKEFVQGRDLFERLQATEAQGHFDKAIALDPEFASAELGRATSSNTAKDFFGHLTKAVNLADKASPGEKLLIQATEAGANGDTAKQKDYLDQLIAAYPNDERAQFSMGNYYFGQQKLADAIEHYKKATELAPNFTTAYNIIGYAYRQQGDYASAGEAFKKYIELIPNDPNPYDSYAEMLLKEGKFDDSITQYRKALSVDPSFFPSHLGIAADLAYLGKGDQAISELQEVKVRNDGESRAVLFSMSVVEADRGKWENALANIDKEYAVAEKNNDAGSKAADLQAKGNILLQMQKYDEARRTFDQSLQIMEASNLSPEVKANAQRNHHFNLAAVALGRKDVAMAKSEAAEFEKAAQANNNPGQTRQAHELSGRIALAEKHYDDAITELQQSNQQDPQNLFRLSQAYRAKGNTAKAQEYCSKAADFNSLPQLNYAFVRVKAQKLTGKAVASKVNDQSKL